MELKNFKTDLEIELVYYCYSIIHPFISFHVSKVGSQWQQVKQGIPDIFPHSNTFMFSVKSFQSQTRYINLDSGSSLCIWKNSKWRQLGDILTRCPSYCRCLILGISQSLANHSAVCWRSSTNEANKTASSAINRNAILKFPKRTYFSHLMILSLNITNMIGDKGQA